MLLDVGLPIGGELALLGEEDHLAGRRGDGPLALLMPYTAVEVTGREEYVRKRYELAVEGNGVPRLAWSRGVDPYRWVDLPLPTEPTLRLKKGTPEAVPAPDAAMGAPATEREDTILWAKETSGRRSIDTRLYVTCAEPSEDDACANRRGVGCWDEHPVGPALESIKVADLLAPRDGELDLSRCERYRVVAKRRDSLSLDGLGLAPGTVCAAERSSAITFERTTR